ncbi:Uncharacterised protein [Yersinia massiliensis]|nr:Uncharacterised protein [Yersinia massiliensis]
MGLSDINGFSVGIKIAVFSLINLNLWFEYVL